MTDLVNLYAEIDHLTMECCAAWLPKAPDRHVQLEMAEQIGEERTHYLSQVAWLNRYAGGHTPIVLPSWADSLRTLVNGMQWLEYLVCVHLVIEGVGIALVERVARDADQGVKDCLAPSLRDEGGHASFGVRQLRRLLQSVDGEERKELKRRVVESVGAISRLASSLPITSAHWEAVGTSADELREIVAKRLGMLLSPLGIDYSVSSSA
tara:strand:- start:517 stop:1143 length:627 start_codon:yes stop_codon:yes gene_type:complete